MKKIMSGLIISLMTSLSATGCGNNPVNSGGDSGGASQGGSQQLSAMHWKLSTVQSNNSAPKSTLNAGIAANRYQFDFNSGRVNISGGCNGTFGQASISGSKIKFGDMASTQKACFEKGLMQADREITQLLKPINTFAVTGNQLTLSGGGNTLVLNGVPTDEAKYGGESIRKFIQLRNTSTGLVWREAKYNNSWIQINKNAPWSSKPFPGIQGFKAQPNMEYTVRIKAFNDASTGRAVWVKDMVTMQGVLR